MLFFQSVDCIDPCRCSYAVLGGLGKALSLNGIGVNTDLQTIEALDK